MLKTGSIATAAAVTLAASPVSAAATPPGPMLPLSAYSFDEGDDEGGHIWFEEGSSLFSNPGVRIVASYTAVALLLMTIWGGNGRPVTP